MDLEKEARNFMERKEDSKNFDVIKMLTKISFELKTLLMQVEDTVNKLKKK